MTRAPVWIVLVILLLSPGVAAAWDFPWDKKKGPDPNLIRKKKQLDAINARLQRERDKLQRLIAERWKKKPVKANVLNRSSAQDWVSRLEAIGGSSQSSFVEAGLTGLANLEGGKTNTHAALMAALGAPQPGQPDDDYELELDTIFFLSDGRPSTGLYVDPDDILREVRNLNALRQVVLHTIALGEFDKTFMRLLAQENGGTFADLGR